MLAMCFVFCGGENSVIAEPGPGSGTTTKPEPEGTPVNMWAIDMTPLEIDGKWYAVWSGWADYWVGAESNDKDQNLYIAEMHFNDTYPLVSLGTRHLLSVPEKPWEMKVGEKFSLLEGPQILKRNGDTFIVYSTRGSWTIEYKLGHLKYKGSGHDPLDRNSWIKSDTPVFKGIKAVDHIKNDLGVEYKVYGVGHASFTTSPDDKEHWIYYHSKTTSAGGWDDRMCFLKKFTFDGSGNPDFGLPPDSSRPQQRPGGEMETEKATGVAEPSATFMNPITEGADPWIVKHGDYYYTCRSIERGIWVTRSRYMTVFEDAEGNKTTDWKKSRRKVWTPPAKTSDKWNRVQHWAPELHYIDGKWYIFYAAGQQTESPYWQHRAGVLVYDGEDPWQTNCFEEHGPEPLFTGEIVK